MGLNLNGFKPLEFNWDKANKDKNWIKHQVNYKECEQIFFKKTLKIFDDNKHSLKEKRLLAYGETDKKRKLTIIFTLRDNKIRVISVVIKTKKKGEFMRKQNKIKPIPKFKNEDEERTFWATHDTTDYFDTSKPIKLDLSELKPSTRPVTIRLPDFLLSDLKILAHKKDVPYQSLMKVFLAERVKKEYQTA